MHQNLALKLNLFCFILLFIGALNISTLSARADPLVEPSKLIQALDCEHLSPSDSAETKHLCQLYLYATAANVAEDLGARNVRPSRSPASSESIFYSPAKHSADNVPARILATRSARNSPSDMMSLLASGVGDDALGADGSSSWNSRFSDEMSMNRWQPMRGKRNNIQRQRVAAPEVE